MDKDLINKLIIVGSVAGAILILYFIMSPYQNCMRTEKLIKDSYYGTYWNDDEKESVCNSRTPW